MCVVHVHVQNYYYFFIHVPGVAILQQSMMYDDIICIIILSIHVQGTR